MRARDNPFRVELLHRLTYRGADFDWARLLRRLDRLGGRGALRGSCGSGKSTLLRELAERLAADGLTVLHHRLHPNDPRAARIEARRLARSAAPGTALLVDGADRLGPLAWRRFVHATRSASIVVVTTHGQGRLPTLHRCATDPVLLRELVSELEPSRPLSLERAGRLLAAHSGSVRDALAGLYDERAAEAP